MIADTYLVVALQVLTHLPVKKWLAFFIDRDEVKGEGVSYFELLGAICLVGFRLVDDAVHCIDVDRCLTICLGFGELQPFEDNTLLILDLIEYVLILLHVD